MLETRDKVAVLQMLSFVTGLLNRDSELLVQLGLKESQTAQLIDDIGKKTKHRDGRVTLGSVYGYNHLGLPPLIKNHFPNSKSHPLATKAVALNRRSYGGLYISEPNFKNDIGLLEEIAARSIVEDIFFIPTHYPEIFGTLTCVTDPMRKIAKVAKDVCDASNGAKKLIETLTPEQAALVLQEKGIVLRL